MSMLDVGILINIVVGIVNLLLAMLSFFTFDNMDNCIMHLLLTIGAFILAGVLSSINNGYYLKDLLNLKEVECKKRKSFFD